MEDLVKRQVELIEIERKAEIEEVEGLLKTKSAKELEVLGLALRNMRVDSVRTGLFGRTVLKLKRGEAIPSTRLGPGDIVSVRSAAAAPDATESTSGVVSKVGESGLTIAFDEPPPPEIAEGGALVVARLGNDVTYRRMFEALGKLTSSKSSLNDMHRALLGTAMLHGPQPAEHAKEKLRATDSGDHARSGLNEEQEDAVCFALSTYDVAIIHGPPGTGKTWSVAELIRRIVGRGERVLAIAPSNVAVDNLAEKLAPSLGKRMVRIGHPARVMQSVSGMTLDSRVNRCDEASIVRDLRKDITRLRSELRHAKADDRRQQRAELSELNRDLRAREARILHDVLTSAAVVLSTATGAGDPVLNELPPFDWVVIDEAAQALEAACWIGLLRGKKCVLAGDDKQLPPTIKSEEAAKKGLSLTLFERLHQKYGKSITRMLRVQYRMNERIMQWASRAMYESGLVAHESVASRLLRHITGVKPEKSDLLESPLFIYDTAGCGHPESSQQGAGGVGESKLNQGEARVVVEIVQELVSAGLKPECVGIISPYLAQVNLLRGLLSEYRGLEIGTVDGFQGREFEAIVISLVRSNAQREVGFLREDRRTNVAITRAKALVVLVCDSDTVSAHPFVKGAVDYFNEFGESRSPLGASGSSEASTTMVVRGFSQPQKRPPPTKAKKPKPVQHKQVPKEADEKGAPPASAAPGKSTDVLEAEIRAFAADESRTKFELPSSLSSSNRARVHQLAEELGLEHFSHGAGDDRRLSLTKHVTVGDEEEEEEKEKEEEEEDEEEEESKTVPTKQVAVSSAPPTKPKPKPKAKKRPEKTKKIVKPKEEPDVKGPKKLTPEQRAGMDDADVAIAELGIDNKHCAKKGCQTLVELMGTNCKFCRYRFCFAHIQPEVHGCGEAAKKHARESSWSAFEQKTALEKLQPYVTHPPRGGGRGSRPGASRARGHKK